ncbi:hypothetical protein [Rhizobium sp. MHM7A]|uniref:hypothetical protein n=1 Tax=Rhizobium sp. MHM7A TaxID=2583233 RepID=UPI001106298E|nr:hypothetical protein [Rhizobium sp. MHM7A]TLX16926.1 hypothetical protein FFR93_06150 [Rhizobium sp. MHM7A]
MEDGKQLVLVLNGPPRAGKNTGIAALEAAFPDAEVFEFFRPVKELLHRERGLDVRHDHFEEVKDEPCPEFDGKAPRYAYIDRGDALEAERGPTALTDFYFAALGDCKAPILITTCGKDSEALQLASMFGTENTLFLRIHMDGKDFSQDSRSWVVSSTLNIRDVTNVKDEAHRYQAEIVDVAREYIATRALQVDYAA